MVIGNHAPFRTWQGSIESDPIDREGGLGPHKKNPAGAGSFLVQDGSIESDPIDLLRARRLPVDSDRLSFRKGDI